MVKYYKFINKDMDRVAATTIHSRNCIGESSMSIYRDAISEALGMTPLPEHVIKEIIEEPIPEDAETKRGGWFSTGNQWCVKTMGPMIKGVHLQTLTGDDRTEAQKEASRKHSKYQKENAITPTPKGGKLSEAHKAALRVPRPGAGKHENHLRGENHPAKVQVTCPHCGKKGGKAGMKRWHMDSCKMKSGDY